MTKMRENIFVTEGGIFVSPWHSNVQFILETDCFLLEHNISDELNRIGDERLFEQSK